MPWLRLHVRDHLRQAAAHLDHHDAVTPNDLRYRRDVYTAIQQLREAAAGYEPSAEEIAATVGPPVTVAMVNRLIGEPTMLPMLPTNEAEFVDGETGTDDDMWATRLTLMLFHNLRDVLDDVDRYVAIRRFGLDGEAPETHAQIGLYVGISRESVRNREAKVLEAVRRSLDEAESEPET
jgi:DNA-directed RNA polymerase sigma subunit (sigma70/sigma32)